MSGETSASSFASLTASNSDQRPTRVRIGVAAVLTLMACLLYLDRFAVGIASEYIREDLRMTQTQMSWFLSAFFWSYALSQVPAGWLSDRFGPRLMLTIYILAWSAFTGLLGLAASVWLVLHLRLYMGAAQAGAFPVCGGLIRTWFPISQRGTASSIIALGGRAGGVLAPILTAAIIIAWSQAREVPAFTLEDVMNNEGVFKRLGDAADSDDPKHLLCKSLFESLPIEKQMAVRWFSGLHLKPLHPIKDAAFFDLKDWLPFSETLPIDSMGQTAEQIDILGHFNSLLNNSTLVTHKNTQALTLHRSGGELLKQRDTERPLSANQTRLLNRLAIEAAMPKEIKKFYGTGWRPTLIAYGIVGLVVALAFAWVARNSPKQHPWCNDAERRLIDDEATLAAKAVEPRDAPFPWRAVLTSLSLWGNSLMQFFTNIGWLFVVTWLPRYLDKVHGVPLAEQALMTAVPTAAGIIGMFCGGWWTDLAARKAGLKWGRRLPVFSTRLLAAFGYGICLAVGMTCTPDPTTRWLPWTIVFGLSVMVMGVDLGVPAVWAYAQDVGGKYTASILGWANMWGNFGAAVAPLIYNAVLGETPTVAQWNLMFAVCGVAFVLSALTGLTLDATKPIVHESAATR